MFFTKNKTVKDHTRSKLNDISEHGVCRGALEAGTEHWR
jgi:hypothetical protein